MAQPDDGGAGDFSSMVNAMEECFGSIDLVPPPEEELPVIDHGPGDNDPTRYDPLDHCDEPEEPDEDLEPMEEPRPWIEQFALAQVTLRRREMTPYEFVDLYFRGPLPQVICLPITIEMGDAAIQTNDSSALP